MTIENTELSKPDAIVNQSQRYHKGNISVPKAISEQEANVCNISIGVKIYSVK